MKKKIFTALVLVVILTRGIYAQQIERLTYLEVKSDGTAGRTVTVKASFLGWEQHNIFMEGNYEVSYLRTRKFMGNGEWSGWEFAGKQPAMLLNLNQKYWTLQREYNRYPNAGVKFHYANGIEVLRILAIADGKSSPFWWAENGQSFFIFFKIYLIIN